MSEQGGDKSEYDRKPVNTKIQEVEELEGEKVKMREEWRQRGRVCKGEHV